MSHTIKIPMNEETRLELEDCFIETKDSDAGDFVFDLLKSKALDAKRSLRNEVTPVNQMQENGQRKQIEFSLKDVDLNKYVLESNPGWLPKSMAEVDNKPIIIKIGDTTMDYLRKFGQITLIRHEEFNKAEEEFLEKQRAEVFKDLPEEARKSWETQKDLEREQRLGEVPTCLEQAIFMSIWPHIHMKLEQSDSLIFDKEYKENKEPEVKPEDKTSA